MPASLPPPHPPSRRSSIASPRRPALTSSVNPSFVNQATTLTATISATPGQTGAPTPVGTVTFKNGNATLGTCTLASGTCTFPATFTTAGNYTLTAAYSGDTNFGASTSTAVTQVVNTYVAGVTLTSSANPAFVTNSTIFTATVAANAGQGTAPAPGGTVTFMYGANTLGFAAVVNGLATFAYTFPSIGSYPITAVYSGDANFLTASSPTLTESVEDFTIAPRHRHACHRDGPWRLPGQLCLHPRTLWRRHHGRTHHL